MVTRWISWIRLFDFTVRHIAGRKHSGPDGLSRRPSDSDVEDDNDSVEECIDDDLGINAISVQFPPAPAPNEIFCVTHTIIANMTITTFQSYTSFKRYRFRPLFRLAKNANFALKPPNIT